MKNKNLLIMVIMVVVFITTGMTTEAASKAKINKTITAMELGESTSLKVTGTKLKVKWSTTSKKVATVDSTGKVIAKAVGDTTITAKVGKTTYKCTVSVSNPYADSTKLSVGKENGVKMIAHRGLSSLAPANSIPAIEMAGVYGYDMVEFDVRETTDGKFVVIHDDSIDKCTNGSGKISQMTYDEVKSVTIDTGANIGKYKNLKVPTLEAVLKTCKQYGITPLVDVKNISDTKAFLKVIKKSGWGNKAVLCSNNKTIIKNIKSANKKAPLYFINSSNANDAIKFAKQYNLNGVSLSYKVVTNTVVDMAKNNNIDIMTWDVYTTSTFDSCVDLGVTGTIVDGVLK
jgi:glycerophosphoryl diester phosphodiesterase